MNFIWSLIMLIGLLIMLITNPNNVLDVIMSGSAKAVSLSIKLWSIYAIWLGILNIVEETKLNKKLEKLLSPIIDFLIGKENSKAKNDIAINISTNIFGMGNASTPSGIKAMEKLDKGSKYITSAMAMLFILNVTSLEIIPSTVLSLRIMHKSSNPNCVILPTLISSFCSTFVGIVLVKIFKNKFKGNK